MVAGNWKLEIRCLPPQNYHFPISNSQLPYAGIAHLVERHLAKVEVASSSLVARSNPEILTTKRFVGIFFLASWRSFYAENAECYEFCYEF